MFDITKKEIEWGGRQVTLETGKVARQADGSVIATMGGTMVMANVVAAKKANPDLDFFPLTVNYQEKAYAAGKIPGGFFKREGRPSEKETLVCRLIDRPIRPLFIDHFKNETQVMCTVLAHDMENDPDIVAMIAVSAALTISGLPFLGPIGAARVGLIAGEYVLNPTLSQMADSDLDLVVAGTSQGVLMVESEAEELSEDTMLGAVAYGHSEYQKVIDAIIDFAEDCAKDPWDIEEPSDDVAKLKDLVKDKYLSGIEAAYKEKVKAERKGKLDAVRTQMYEDLLEEYESEVKLDSAFKSVEKDHVRGAILETQMRIDGRDTKTVRPIVAEVDILPNAHGSALFTRGETQALVVTTLGSGQDEQIIDSLEGESRQKFMLHYNFPPYSVGEVGRAGSPGRREIGHGKLAWRAVNPLLPSSEEFPYTIRIVSEITESNGSSSMATVCGTSLAMMAAGVPLERPIAGIAMGLIKEGDDFAVLSDILGDEDHLGDMDFKVAGTEKGVTSLQMDIKITSITEEIMKIALEQAHGGRIHILGEMAKAISEARTEFKDSAPKVEIVKIHPDKIRDVIGSGGKVIKELCETTNSKIDIDDDGTVRIMGADQQSAAAAREKVEYLTANPEEGEIYEGKVVKVVDFGAFVNFLGGKDGLVHISELRPERTETVSDVVNEGDEVKVKLVGFDNRGKIKLSMRVVDQETGEDLTSEEDKEKFAQQQQPRKHRSGGRR